MKTHFRSRQEEKSNNLFGGSAANAACASIFKPGRGIKPLNQCGDMLPAFIHAIRTFQTIHMSSKRPFRPNMTNHKTNQSTFLSVLMLVKSREMIIIIPDTLTHQNHLHTQNCDLHVTYVQKENIINWLYLNVPFLNL